jgi:hypothetical protein
VYPLPSTRAWAIAVAPDSLHDLGSAAAAPGVVAAPPLCFPTMAADGAPDSLFANLALYLPYDGDGLSSLPRQWQALDWHAPCA